METKGKSVSPTPPESVDGEIKCSVVGVRGWTGEARERKEQRKGEKNKGGEEERMGEKNKGGEEERKGDRSKGEEEEVHPVVCLKLGEEEIIMSEQQLDLLIKGEMGENKM